MSSRKRAELKSEAEVYLTLDHPHVAKPGGLSLRPHVLLCPIVCRPV